MKLKRMGDFFLMTDFFKKNKKLLFILLILIQVIYISVSFGINKKGYHSDEAWNYGFANSSQGMHIYWNGEESINLINWVDCDVMRDYISVDKSEIFAFDKIFDNAARDLNPPLQYIVLHIICSFFLNKWSKWFCFFLNICCFIITQIYIYRLVKGTTDSDMAAFATTLMYGFSVGALSIASFLRIYAMGVMFVAMFIYYTNEVYKHRDDVKADKKDIIKAAIVLLLGALTIHQFLIVAFAIVFTYCAALLFGKRFKAMLAFGLSMLLSVGLSILIFPSTISHLFGNKGFFVQNKYPTGWQFRIYWSFLTKDITGLHVSAFKGMTLNYLFVALVILVMILVPVSFLLRKEPKFRAFIGKLRDSVVACFKNIKSFPVILIVIAATLTFFLYINADISSIARMGIFSRRYIFLAYPLYAAFVGIVLHYILKAIFKKLEVKAVISILLVLVMVGTTYVYSYVPFYFNYEADGLTEGMSLDEIEDDANCILVLTEVWLSTAATVCLYDKGSFYTTNLVSYEQSNYAEGIDVTRPLYLILDCSKFSEDDKIEVLDAEIDSEEFGFYTQEYKKELLDYYEALPIATKLEFVGVDFIYDRIVEIYRLN